MRNKSFAALGTLALLAAASAFGQQRLTVDIPFGFDNAFWPLLLNASLKLVALKHVGFVTLICFWLFGPPLSCSSVIRLSAENRS